MKHKLKKVSGNDFYGIYMTGHAVALLVEALCYKPEGSEFDSR
jgi:hypothetical protein